MPNRNRRSISEVRQSQARERYQGAAGQQVRDSALNAFSLEANNRYIKGLENYRRRLVKNARKEFGGSLEFNNRYWRSMILVPALLWLYFFFNYHPIVHLFELDKIESNSSNGSNDLLINSIVFGTSVALVAGAIGISSARHNAHEQGRGAWWHVVTILFFCASVLASLSLQFALLKTDTATFDASEWSAIGFKVLLIFAVEAGILYADVFFFYGLAWLQTWLVLIAIGVFLIVARWRQRRLNAAINGSVRQLGDLANNYEAANNEQILTPPVAAKTREGFREVMGYEVIPEPPAPANPAPVDVDRTRTVETERPPAPAQTRPVEEPTQPDPEATLDPDEVARENERLRQELEARARRDESEVRP